MITLPSLQGAREGTTQDTHKFHYIDVMRGIAILLVVLVHTSQSVPNLPHVLWAASSLAQMGVQLFLVASALTLYLSASERGLATPLQVRKFYLRRFFRIAPLYYAAIVLYSLLPLAAGSRPEPGFWWGVVANVCFLHGLIPSANNTVVPGGWSIGAEMLFYAGFPLMFRFINSRARAVGFFVAALSFDVVFQALRCHLTGGQIGLANNSFWYFLIVNQLPVFGCGALLFFQINRAHRPKPASSLVAAGGMAVALAWCFFRLKMGGLAFAFVPALAGLSFLLLGQALSGCKLQDVVSRSVSEIGRKSFSIYILHFLFAWYLSRHLIPVFSRRGITPSFELLLCFSAAVLLSYVCACFTAPLIEDVGIRLGKKATARLA